MSGANNAPGDAGTDHENEVSADKSAASAGSESPEEGKAAEQAAEDAVIDG